MTDKFMRISGVLLILGACTPFTEIDVPISDAARNAPWPVLLPMDRILTQSPNATNAEDIARNIQARANNLRSRANALRSRQIIERDMRARMQAALSKRR